MPPEIEAQAAAPQVAEESTDRKSLLGAAFEEAESGSAAPAPADGEGRERNEKGQFVAKEPKGEAAPAEQEPPLWARPPNSWKKDYHEVWQTAAKDPNLAKLVEYAWQREEEMRQGVEPLKTKAQVADAFNQTVEPYLPILNGLGVEPMTAVKALMENDRILRYGTPAQKQAKAVELMNAYGISFDMIDPNQIRPVDPAVQALQNELLQLRGQIATGQQQQTEAEDAHILREATAAMAGLEHYERVKPTMMALLDKGLVGDDNLPIAELMKLAYEKAIRLDDDLWKEVQQGQQAAAEAQARAAADQAAKNARRAAVSPPSSTPGAPPAPKAQDRKSMLAEQFDGLEARL